MKTFIFECIDLILSRENPNEIYSESVHNPNTSGTINTKLNLSTDTEDQFKQQTPFRADANRFKDNSNVFKNAAVATEVPLCSEIGIRILKKGGNAVDAGIASSICVGIINSFSSGIGGGGFALFRNSLENTTACFDFREISPNDIDSIKHKKDYSLKGATAIGVPGEVYGLYLAKKKYGDSYITWSDLFEDNIIIATKGFIVTKELEKRITKFKEDISGDEGLKNTFFINGAPAKAGDTIKRENLAETLKIIATNPLHFYTGELMESMVQFIQSKGGVISKTDFQKYKVRVFEREEVPHSNFLDYKVFTTPLPSSGEFLLFGLNIFEKYGLEEFKSKTEAEQIYILVEIMKYMFARRGEFGDSNDKKYEPLIAEITSKDYAKQIFDEISNSTNKEQSFYKMSAPFNENFGTTHINVIDEEGRIFAINSSINLEFGAKIMDPKTGIIFNNQINDFYIPTDSKNLMIHNSSENKVEASKRPLSSMCPIILERGDEKIVIGAAGGTRILTSVFLTLINTLIGKTMKEAISYKRIHHQLEPYKVFFEKGVNKEILDYLKTKRNLVEESEIHSVFTSVQGIRTGPLGIEAFSDERKGGESAGY